MSKWSDFIAAMAERGKRVFTTKDVQDIAGELGISSSYVPTMLARLKAEGWIEPLKQGMYALGKGFGFAPLHEFEIAMHLTAPAAISHRSAFHHYSLTDQIPRTVYILTTTESTTPRSMPGKNVIEVHGVPYVFVRVKKERFFGLSQEWIGPSKILITDPERTLLDGLIRPQYCGGFDEVRHAFKIYRDKLNLERIIEYSLNLGGAVTKRLGWILENIGFSDEMLLPLLRKQSLSFSKLDPSRPLRGPCHPIWRVRDNTTGE